MTSKRGHHFWCVVSVLKVLSDYTMYIHVAAVPRVTNRLFHNHFSLREILQYVLQIAEIF